MVNKAAQKLGRKGGLVKSEKKRLAAIENSKKAVIKRKLNAKQRRETKVLPASSETQSHQSRSLDSQNSDTNC